ncbi:MAG: hypothetical protein AAF547_22295 [Actinomycetota bacterium]
MERPPDRPQDAISLACHNFSDIRRRPLVIGKLDQVRLPFVVTMPQLAVGVLVFGLLFLTRPVWGSLMSDRLHIVVFVVVPVVAAQQISRTTVEGRSLFKAAAGLVRLWLAPRHGTINGRRQRPAEAVQLTVHPLVPAPTTGGDHHRRPRSTPGRRAGTGGRADGPAVSRRTARRRQRQEQHPDQADQHHRQEAAR